MQLYLPLEQHELIDTQWNVNYISDKVNEHKREELIDTQWNVNFDRQIFILNTEFELIDTQWNVNNGFISIYNTNGVRN